MSNNEPLAILTTGIAVFNATPNPVAVARKNELLELASLVLSVTSEEEQADAIDAASQIKAVEQQFEKSRKEVKAPILQAGKDVDEAARLYSEPLTKERMRIENLLSAFVADQRRKHEAEVARQRQIAEAAAKQEAEKENARLRAEREEQAALAQALGEEPPPPSRTVTPMVVMPNVSEAPRVEGGSFKEEYDFEVTDIHALYAWNRLFVKLEVDRANLKAFLNMTGRDPGQIPGLNIVKTQKLIVRAVKETAPRIVN